MGSRAIADLTPRMQELYQKFDAKMREAGITYVVTSTARTILEQMALFVQGRLPLETVNSFRSHAGLQPITAEDNVICTWTLDSKHVTNMLDPDLDRHASHAFDIAIVTGGKATWDLKVDVNHNGLPDYDEAATIGESVGLRAGARFKPPDRPDRCHFEDPDA